LSFCKAQESTQLQLRERAGCILLSRLPFGPGGGADNNGAPACRGDGHAHGLGEGALHRFGEGGWERGGGMKKALRI